MIDTIMERHGKDLAKFFKGRFEEVKKQQTQAGAQKEPDPTEQGLEGALQAKQKEAAQPPSAGGYYLPMAGPEAQLRNAAVNANLAAARSDPQRMLQSQLTSGEQRQAELGQAGLALTPKLSAELEKSALELSKFKAEADKAASELKVAQERAVISGQRDEATLAGLRLKNQKALTDLDIARQRLLREQAKTKGAQQLSQSYRLKFGAINQAQTAINSLVGGKITKDNVVNLINLLKAAGATGLANDLASQQKSMWVNYGLGSYEKPEELLKSLQAYKDAFKTSFKLDDQGNPVGEGEESEGDMEETEEPGAVSGEPMQGDEIEWQGQTYIFQGGDPNKRENYKPKAKPR
jgi:hypothetical protein